MRVPSEGSGMFQRFKYGFHAKDLEGFKSGNLRTPSGDRGSRGEVCISGFQIFKLILIMLDHV